MTTFTLRKGELKNEDKRFTGINTEALGVAAGKLSVAGLRLYLYLAGHKDGIQWTVNPSVYADWLGIDYSTKGRTVRKTLNDGISNDLGSTDLLIGHSYFMNKTITDLCAIMNRHIIPLLYEYFFDNQKKVEAQIKAATAGYPVEVKVGTVGRIQLMEKGAE